LYSVLFAPEDPEGIAKAAFPGSEVAAGVDEDDEDDEGEDEATAVGPAEPAWLKLLNPASLVVRPLVNSATERQRRQLPVRSGLLRGDGR